MTTRMRKGLISVTDTGVVLPDDVYPVEYGVLKELVQLLNEVKEIRGFEFLIREDRETGRVAFVKRQLDATDPPGEWDR